MKSVIFYLAKYTFRLLHVTTFGLIFGNLFYDYLYGKRIDTLGDNRKEYVTMHIISSVVLMVSGLINMIILVKENNYVKNTYYQVWKKLLIWKFMLTFAITPLLERFIKDQALCFKIRVYVVCGLLLISPFLRYFREYCLNPQKKTVITSETNNIKSN
jgi:hypothetical protein